MNDIRFDTYYRYDAITGFLQNWAERYPRLCRLESMGQSYEGRDIWVMVLTNFDTGPDKEKPAYWVDGNIHATEVSPSSAALYLINKLLTEYGQDDKVTYALDSRVFYVVPRLNPDGAELALADKPKFIRSSTRPYPRTDSLQLALSPISERLPKAVDARVSAAELSSFTHTASLATDLPPGSYRLVARDPRFGAVCGWLAAPREGCLLGQVEIRGVPLPPGATNFEDKIALLSVDVESSRLRPGGRLPVDLTWQSLAPMDQDYTVFVQVLDDQGQLVAQVDAQPLQGTFPTSQWQPGQVIDDSYQVQLREDLPPGSYRLQVGLYLLATLRRLPVLNEDGLPVDDKVVVAGLVVP